MAWAVRAMIGVALVRGSARSCRVASQPSSSGRLMSIRIMSKDAADRHRDALPAVAGDGYLVAFARRVAA